MAAGYVTYVCLKMIRSIFDPPCGADPFYNRQVQEGLADLTGFVCNVLSFPLFCLKQYR